MNPLTFEKHMLMESKCFVMCEGGTWRAVAAFITLAPSRCILRSFAFASSLTCTQLTLQTASTVADKPGNINGTHPQTPLGNLCTKIIFMFKHVKQLYCFALLPLCKGSPSKTKTTTTKSVCKTQDSRCLYEYSCPFDVYY